MVTRRTERVVRRVLMWGATGLLAVVAVFLATSTWRVYSKMSTAHTERLHAEEERNLLSARTKELGAALEALKTDRGIESQIRERYPLVKPGEVEFVMVDGPAGTTSDAVASTSHSLWGRIGQWLDR